MRGIDARLTLALLASTALNGGAAFAQSLPTGGRTASGSVTISPPSGNTLNIRQSSQGAIVNWQGFSIGQGNSVNIHQPNSSAALLNRVTGSTPSTIAGRLNANGQVYLVNPNGVAITKTGVVKASGFVASTLGVSDGDFLSGKGKLKFKGAGASKAVTNDGVIRVGRGGYAALIGGTISNTGKILAPMGKVGLGSGEAATLDFSGNGFLKVAAPTNFSGKAALVSTTGTIRADGGLVVIEAATAREMARNAVNIGGLVQARSIGGHSGAIVIGAGPGGAVNVSGALDASSISGKGGRIAITGREIALRSATVDVSGGAGGGKVSIGGGPQGTGKLPHAASVRIDAATTIKANATKNGEGGSVVVWSDGATSVKGRITARGAGSGGGGAVETSGKTVDFAGLSVDTSAPRGGAGIWLIDPVDLTVGAAAAKTISDNLASTNVTLQTTAGGASGPGVQSPGAGDITIASAISWSSSQSLTLDAYHALAINTPITITGGGQLSLKAAADPAIPTLALLSFGQGASVQFTGAPGAGQALNINGKAYTLLTSMSDVLGVNSNLAGSYALANPLDAAGTTYTDALIGSGYFTRFSGMFEGLGNTIAHLVIDAPSSYDTGLFATLASTAVVSDLGISGGRLGGFSMVGAIAGTNLGSITRSFSSASVQYSLGGGYSGGLVGNNLGLITRSHSTGVVSGSLSVGGLVGTNGGSITDSYATGAVSLTTGSFRNAVGGLVGYNTGLIEGSFETGNVTGKLVTTGGLVGANYGAIIRDYATGAVKGADNSVGGLVGANSQGGTIEDSHASGAVTGTTDVGGLVGRMIVNGFVSGSYADGTVSGTTNVGGLVGQNDAQPDMDRVSITRSYATGAVSGDVNVGGLVGDNHASVTESYSTGAVSGQSGAGGLAGNNSGSIATSYWDTITSGQAQGVGVNTGSFGATSLTTAQFVNKKNFVGWSFGTAPGGDGWVIVDQGGTLNNAGGQAGATRPFLLSEYSTNIVNAHQLQLMALSTTANYTLGADIDLGPALTNPSEHWFTPANTPFPISGFNPIGQDGNQFSGIFDGKGHTISNLTIERPTNAKDAAHWTGTNVGLFGYVHALGVVENVSLVGGAVTGYHTVGALVGKNHGTVRNDSASTSVNGRDYIGGLVGWSYGTLTQDSASGSVSGNNYVGGLTGANNFSVSLSSASGPVSGVFAVGGLVGENAFIISLSHAAGAVSGAAGGDTGGLVGMNQSAGSIAGSYATGAVSGGSGAYVGGLVGYYYKGGSISGSSAAGAVSGAGDFMGGLVGFAGDSISDSSATGAVTGGSYVGGLAGWSYGVITRGEASGAVSGYLYVGGLTGGASKAVTNSAASGSVNGDSYIGGLAGYIGAGGSVSQSNATGAVSASANYAGGLVGVIAAGGSVSSASATGTVSGDGYIGGLAGWSFGTVSTSNASGQVSGNQYVGGLTGGDSNAIKYSFATGPVNGNSYVGGLSGYVGPGGSLSQAYATGMVSATANYAGGLVGKNVKGVISSTYATGNVTGRGYIGGLVGFNSAGGVVSQSYAVGAVSGDFGYTGGLIGENLGGYVLSSAYWDKITTGQTRGVGTNIGFFAATGRTTTQLQAALPAGFDPAIWAIVPNITYPFLKKVPPQP
ncbi:beta strand repeat-containing protein [Methylocapsa palsarum]|uniref:Filamentous hemagglutinin family N-terminal domain-containing protein n=1 Tax=Methylocapsa palsarum TaxID=1612308 RepID=A0A1I4A2K2_9HYPH|nr:GLUG motif-containing protein [Methylocapsa palsarum]SFK50096.1 filamentous hemagglutinin family N-terminal domain-containing protein [Methylocapsa palsarum]